jgi:L-alanine-DL-glutamate epimerase-like enolase superfamily enzyme
MRFSLARAGESEEDPMTRIASIATYPISVPRPVVTWTAQEEMKAWSVILTELKTDDGLTGYGLIHGSPMPRICEWVARFADIVSGMDALAHEAVWDRLFGLTCPRPGAIDSNSNVPPPLPRGERTQIMAAIAGIDIALWDLKGKAAGLPVYRLLGGENKPLTTYATGGYYRAGARDADYGEELARFVVLGYRAVKLKTGAGSPADEAKRVGAVRAAIGDADLMLDMNAPYDLHDCIDFARRVEPHRVFWLEEPLHWYLQPADFAKLAAASPIPLAHGERELTRFTVRDFIVEGGIRYVQFDATRAAGFTEALRVAALAEQLGVIVAPHTAPEIHGHLVLALPRCAFGVESHGGKDTDPVAYGLFHEHPVLRDGYLHLGDKPGFGLHPDWRFVEKYRA